MATFKCRVPIALLADMRSRQVCECAPLLLPSAQMGSNFSAVKSVMSESAMVMSASSNAVHVPSAAGCDYIFVRKEGRKSNNTCITRHMEALPRNLQEHACPDCRQAVM